MAVAIRSAKWRDVRAMAAIMERRRARYAAYQPVFWKRAVGAEAKTRRYFRWLLLRRAATVLVAARENDIAGLLIAIPAPVPPVYDPGGRTVTIDDFAVADEADWPTAGAALLAEARGRGRAAGWRQIVVVCAAEDAAKTALLQSTDLALASTWWTAVT